MYYYYSNCIMHVPVRKSVAARTRDGSGSARTRSALLHYMYRYCVVYRIPHCHWQASTRAASEGGRPPTSSLVATISCTADAPPRKAQLNATTVPCTTTASSADSERRQPSPTARRGTSLLLALSGVAHEDLQRIRKRGSAPARSEPGRELVESPWGLRWLRSLSYSRT